MILNYQLDQSTNKGSGVISVKFFTYLQNIKNWFKTIFVKKRFSKESRKLSQIYIGCYEKKVIENIHTLQLRRITNSEKKTITKDYEKEAIRKVEIDI